MNKGIELLYFICKKMGIYLNHKLTSLGVEVVQVVHHELVAGHQFRTIEVVLDVPADGPVLLPLLDDVVEEGHAEQEVGPGGMVGVVNGVLLDVGVGPLQAGPQALGGLVGELVRDLEQTDGEVLVEVRGEPELKVPVHLVGVDHGDD